MITNLATSQILKKKKKKPWSGKRRGSLPVTARRDSTCPKGLLPPYSTCFLTANPFETARVIRPGLTLISLFGERTTKVTSTAVGFLNLNPKL
jgi:hypothetical protein